MNTLFRVVGFLALILGGVFLSLSLWTVQQEAPLPLVVLITVTALICIMSGVALEKPTAAASLAPISADNSYNAKDETVRAHQPKRFTGYCSECRRTSRFELSECGAYYVCTRNSKYAWEYCGHRLWVVDGQQFPTTLEEQDK